MTSPASSSAPADRVYAIEARIAAACARAGRARTEVTLVAVTKNRPLAAVREVLSHGITECAENRVQDAAERFPQLTAPARTFHLIGHLQTNKAKYLPGLVQWVHSVDSIAVADALEKAMQRRPELPPMRMLLQVNIAGEEQKFGVEPADARALLEHAAKLPRLKVEGLMAMAPFDDNPEMARPHFRALRVLRDELQAATGIALPHLSMGMTGDFEPAIEEGATLVRIGTALFE